MRSPAVFLDKDGTLIEDLPYNVVPSLIRLAPGAAEGVVRLHAAGYRLLVISNQSGVARGIFREEALAAVEETLRSLLSELGVPLAGFYYCPHHPEGVVPGYAIDCSCRKPGPGLILRAAEDHAIDLERSWFVGDILDDVEAGRLAGCRTVLIDNGNETEWVLTPARWPHHRAADLAEAASLIVEHRRAAPPTAEPLLTPRSFMNIALDPTTTSERRLGETSDERAGSLGPGGERRLRAAGCPGRRPDDDARDPRLEGVAAGPPDHARDLPRRRGRGAARPRDRRRLDL